MSDPVPPQPPANLPAASRISDRAALEAALAGAAGLLLGRLLLGRGAGLLAGTAAIAARLLIDAAAKKPAEGNEAMEPAPPPSAGPDPLAPAVQEMATPLPAPLQEESNTALESANEGFPFASNFTNHPEDTSVPLDDSPGVPHVILPETFGNLFTEAFPTPAAPNAATAAVWPKAPGPAAEKISPADLSGFPDISADLPHPDEIWRMAAAESAPVPAPALVTTAVNITESAPAGNFPAPLASTPLWPAPPLFEADQENPFAAPLSAAAPTVSTGRNAVPAPAPSPEAEPPPGFPDVTPYDSTHAALFSPAEARPNPNPFPDQKNSAESFQTPPEVKVPSIEEISIPAAAPAPLPVISLKVKPAPVFSEPAVPPNSVPVAPRPEATGAVLAGPADPAIAPSSQPTHLDPEVSSKTQVPAPSHRSRRGWLVLLLLAAILAWIYRAELKKAVQPRAVQPFPNQSAAPTSPLHTQAAPSPVITPPSASVPAPASVPSPSANAVPKLPDAPVPDNQAAIARPASPPQAPSASAQAPNPAGPIILAEPLPGVPQDFLPDSLEGKARQTLEKLLTAGTLPEIAPLIHDSTAALKQAAQWFPDGNPKPVSWKRIIFDSSDWIPRSAFKASLFRVVTDQVPLGFPVAVEQTRNGPRIDFPAFVQCRDRLLDAFIAKAESPPQSFLVLLRRGHYFGNDLSSAELEQLICFEVAAPNPGSPKHRVFIQRGSDLGRLAVRRFVWDKSYTPVVELTRTGKHIEITALVRDTWRVPGP